MFVEHGHSARPSDPEAWMDECEHQRKASAGEYIPKVLRCCVLIANRIDDLGGPIVRRQSVKMVLGQASPTTRKAQVMVVHSMKRSLSSAGRHCYSKAWSSASLRCWYTILWDSKPHPQDAPAIHERWNRSSLAKTTSRAPGLAWAALPDSSRTPSLSWSSTFCSRSFAPYRCQHS